ncbi:MAG: hypothetical protein N2449_00410 [Bacteroidales bacterium]|nr:hypothetical protein [Bacteroidales bacterium]
MNIYWFVILFFILCSCQQNTQNQPSVNNDTLQTSEFLRPNYKQVFYYEDGQIKFIQEYYNGIKHGIYKNWYENGNIRTLGAYHLGFRKGVWSWFNEEGKLEFQVNYDNQLANL